MKIIAALCFLLGLAKGIGLIVLLAKDDYSRGGEWFIKQGVYTISLLAAGVTLWFVKAKRSSSR
jgi:hypothetical protein